MAEYIRETIIRLEDTFELSHSAEKAIGYLSTWAIGGSSDRYQGPCTVYGDRNGDLHGTYRNKAGEPTYAIFGMRDASADGEESRFSFHS
jgi:hypothetical protein